MRPTKKNVARSFAFLLLGFGSWLGCKTTEVASAAKITGGNADSKSFPATVALVGLNGKNELIGFCTGTFIRDDLVITAAHCTQLAGLDSFMIYSEAAPFNKTRPLSRLYTVHPGFSMSLPSPRPQDVAFIVFDKNTAPAAMIAKLSNKEPGLNEPVTMVGYGGTTFDWLWEEQGVRRRGENVIADTLHDKLGPYTMFKVTSDRREHPEANAATNWGDSGGPLYNSDGELIGITQTGKYREGGDYWDTRFVDLQCYGVKTYIDSQLAGKEPTVDMKPAAAAVSASTPKTPLCVANNGQGVGPVTECDVGHCAKLEADLKTTCKVYPNWQGRTLCVANRGRGYGKIFDCNGLRCAHHDSALTKECVLAAIVYED